MKTRSQIDEAAKRTIGYSEAKDRESFMTGVSVAISIMEAEYESVVEQLRIQRDMHKSESENYKTDLHTLATIINNYL